MKGARALAGAAFLLVAVSIAPAASIAQDSGSASVDPTVPTTPTTPTTPTLPPPGNVTGADKGGNNGGGGAQPDPQSSESTSQTTAAPVVTRSATAHASASASVTMGDFFFSPSSVTVAVGDTVTWKNTGQAPHNATADDGSFKTPDLNNGQSASHTFNAAGTFTYICTIHPNMHGTVRVLASSGGGGGGGGGGGSSSSGSGQTEAAAVASPNAAGTSSTLPMTGLAVGGLIMIGLTLLTSGIVVRWLDPEGRGRAVRFLSIF